MWQLNLPEYQFRVKKDDEKVYIFDNLRKRYVRLTPEEWVRQNFISYLIVEKKFPASRIAIEKQIILNGMKKRCDAIYFNEKAEPEIIFEFKSPEIQISQATLDQTATYNSKLKVSNFILSNGIVHCFCNISNDKKLTIYSEIPDFEQFRMMKT
jgi:hypothetical protein